MRHPPGGPAGIDHPLAASFLVRLGWPDARGPNILLDFVERDLRRDPAGRFTRMPIALALNIVAGAVLGASHCMLEPGCESDFAEQTAAAALRGLGVDAAEAKQIATRRLQAVEPPTTGVFAETVALSARSDPPARSAGPVLAPRARRPVGSAA